MRFIRTCLSLLMLALVAGAALFVVFAVDTFSFRQRPVEADAIVVLTGGRGRVEEGLRLYREGAGAWLFFIGVDPSVRKTDLYRERPGERSAAGVVIEKVSRNTLENAVYARELIVRKHIGSIRLITSRYHMKRAILIFRTIFPRDVAIYPHPIDSRNLHEEWWSHGGSIRLLFTEFYKYYLYRLFFLVGGGELSGVRVGG
ncbi:MAG TPA: YdcF family protein [Geobacteraceae bacterium]